jgi:hypothetical protein
MEVAGLPGAVYIEAGLDDLARGVESVPALLVAIGAPRLRRAGNQQAQSSRSSSAAEMIDVARNRASGWRRESDSRRRGRPGPTGLRQRRSIIALEKHVKEWQTRTKEKGDDPSTIALNFRLKAEATRLR